MIHEVKIKQEYAQAYFDGLKPWEILINDRNYKVGDIVRFYIIGHGGHYDREITYLHLLDDGYCIMTLSGYEYIL